MSKDLIKTWAKNKKSTNYGIIKLNCYISHMILSLERKILINVQKISQETLIQQNIKLSTQTYNEPSRLEIYELVKKLIKYTYKYL